MAITYQLLTDNLDTVSTDCTILAYSEAPENEIKQAKELLNLVDNFMANMKKQPINANVTPRHCRQLQTILLKAEFYINSWNDLKKEDSSSDVRLTLKDLYKAATSINSDKTHTERFFQRTGGRFDAEGHKQSMQERNEKMSPKKNRS
jgi:hypothetical protein